MLLPSHDAIAEASRWVKRFAALIPEQGAVLDLACGSGRHSRYLASAGFTVTAVDRDISLLVLDNASPITAQELNLELDTWPLEDRIFDGIVVTNYLYRPHLDQLPQMLAAEGVLIYETFAQGNEAFGKPSNPNFLLKAGELLALVQRHGLKVVAYEDIYEDKPKPAMMQRICAVKAF
jgi:SAM-dependent methyltransferase